MLKYYLNKKDAFLMHLFYAIKSIIIPQIIPIANSIPSILKFSLVFLFILNSTRIPIPEPTSKPLIIALKLITFLRYNCVNITDPAQFGIKPTRPEIIGPTTGKFNTSFDIFSSPIK